MWWSDTGRGRRSKVKECKSRILKPEDERSDISSLLWGFVLPFVCVMVVVGRSAESDVPGGVMGTVYSRADSLDPPWVPQSNVLVIVETVEGDSLPVPGEVTLTVRDARIEPSVHVAMPGATLRIVSRSSRIQTVVAENEAGIRRFSIALPMPGLEVMKRLDDQGLLTVYPKDGGIRRGATILVLPNMGSAVTDTTGSFLIPGIPAGCRTLWAFDPSWGSIRDSVCVEPARATEVDLYLPHLPAASDETSDENHISKHSDIVD